MSENTMLELCDELLLLVHELKQAGYLIAAVQPNHFGELQSTCLERQQFALYETERYEAYMDILITFYSGICRRAKRAAGIVTEALREI